MIISNKTKQMKKKTKIALGIGATLTAIGGGIFFWRRKKKQKNEEAEPKTVTSESADTEKVNVTEEKEPEKPEVKNFSRGIFVDGLFDKEDDEVWSKALDVSRALEADKRVIHVCQNDFRGRTFLEFKLHCPRVLEEGNWTLPRDVDYLRQIKSIIPEIKKIWGDSVTIKTPVMGYFVLAVNEEQCIYCRVPKELYSSFATEKSEGLVEFIRAAREGSLKDENVVKIPAIAGVDMTKVEAKYIELMFSISIDVTSIGIEEGRENGVKTLDFLLNNLKIKGHGDRNDKNYLYRRILFHVPNKPLEHFYDVEVREDGKKHIVDSEAYF